MATSVGGPGCPRGLISTSTSQEAKLLAFLAFFYGSMAQLLLLACGSTTYFD